MSSFFMYIKKTFLNQSKEDFEIVGEAEEKHYKDKTFCFESEKVENNCFISLLKEKNYEFFKDMMFYCYFGEWKKKDYSYPEFNIKKTDLNPILTYEYIQKLNSKKNKNYQIDKYDWTNNWERILKEDEEEKLKKDIFEEFALKKIFNYFKDNIPELIKEYEKLFEIHSISECKKKKMKYLIEEEDINDETGYKMVEKNFEDLTIFKNIIDCTNIQQGMLGTCYFLEALSILSNYGQLIYQLFPVEKIKNDGFYEICLYHKEEWYKVLIDDYFVFHRRKNESDPLEFYFTQPAKECLYSCFLEKAYAKIKGSYCDINGGYPMTALSALTGFDSLYFKNSKINKEFINQIKNFLKKGYLLSGSSSGHAYSIIGTLDDYFIARNPWSSLDTNDQKMQKKYNLMKKIKIHQDKDKTKSKNKIKGNSGLFKIMENDFKQFFDMGIDMCICFFGTRVYKIKLESIGVNSKSKNLYFTFETFETSKIIFTLQNSLDTEDNKLYNSNDEFSVKLECISNKDDAQNKITFNEFKKT